jgi:glycosyltransferase involved in cell wall biosynthesis
MFWVTTMVNSEYPLITFVILSYNCQKYVQDAINGAFAQSYPNLEIVISDDCSQDDSYSIIKNTVSAYRGKHKVVVNRNESNLGTLANFFRALDICSGELIVMSAGDDISKAERVSTTVEYWRETGATAFFSNYELIDEQGSVTCDMYSPGQYSEMVKRVFCRDSQFEIHGASSAYEVDFVKSLPRPYGKILFEDAYMTFMLNLHSKNYIKIDSPLVYYREHSGSLSNSSNILSRFSGEVERQISMLNAYENRYILSVFLKNYASSFSNPNFNAAEYERQLNKFKIKSEWHQFSTLRMLSFLVSSDIDVSFKKWILPRVFGLRVFVTLKLMFRHFKKFFKRAL